jgi:hypothetical protein
MTHISPEELEKLRKEWSAQGVNRSWPIFEDEIQEDILDPEFMEELEKI